MNLPQINMTNPERTPQNDNPENTPDSLPDLATIQERHPDWPKLNLSFYFSSHGNDQDTQGVAPHLAKADILLYEDAPRDITNLEVYNHLSQNPHLSRRAVSMKLKGSDSLPMALGVRKTGKAIGTIDVGKDVEEVAMIRRLNDLFGYDIPRSFGYEDALQYIHASYDEIVAIQQKREAMMVDNFEEEIDRILYARPDIIKKSEVNILITMGAYHTQLYHAFRERGIEANRDFSKSPYRYDFKTELERSIAFDREPSHEMLERVLGEDMLYRALYEVNSDMDKNVKHDDAVVYVRNVVPSLRSDDIRAMYEVDTKNNLTTAYIDTLLASHGHSRLPRSGRELRKQIEKTKKRKLGRKAIRG